ncbi:pyridoxal-dependent decarboxylase, exosortase A system-associated [Undibacterium sp. Jales W-56]|uniref:pyridoxal-dependent decarboxylase, exosortase A system-associated n=1 Tax=Undibacterium sp. Jales W-56 TaxID=2897325 RepID=UPI0021CF8E9B|nr:pyridoxal-dependent decarboxylase, exosortase A system-associated [Undibacterium sp. Jales W-56]MCU6434138.1 pyridoxal-dependent decarboxylase, exosortase A system-associated [Undibacterium sp. Jales W-56]
MKPAKPVHATQTQFAVIDGELQLGGMSIRRLAQRVGSTPFFVYDRQALTARVAHVRAHLPQQVLLHYSLKANPMPAVVQHMAGLVDGLDVASGGELKIALDTPTAAAKINFTGPGKTDAELAQAIAAGIVINLESSGELRRIDRLAQACGIQASVMVRVNPDFELKSSGMKMAGGAKQFGVDAELVPALLKELATAHVHFHGFQIYSGSQNLKAEAIIEAQAKTFELALQLSGHAPHAPQLINIGGGFGIPYFPGELPLDIAPIGQHLHHWVAQLATRMPGTRIATEMGRYLVGEAGVYITRVVDRKISRGQVFLITDGGMNHHLAASGNLGQVIRKNYPVVIATKMYPDVTEVTSITGPLCTPLDLLADQMALAQADRDDLVAVFQSGAYGLTASPNDFLGHARPLEILV